VWLKGRRIRGAAVGKWVYNKREERRGRDREY
jgi:hypothetical protein